MYEEFESCPSCDKLVSRYIIILCGGCKKEICCDECFECVSGCCMCEQRFCSSCNSVVECNRCKKKFNICDECISLCNKCNNQCCADCLTLCLDCAQTICHSCFQPKQNIHITKDSKENVTIQRCFECWRKRLYLCGVCTGVYCPPKIQNNKMILCSNELCRKRINCCFNCSKTKSQKCLHCRGLENWSSSFCECIVYTID